MNRSCPFDSTGRPTDNDVEDVETYTEARILDQPTGLADLGSVTTGRVDWSATSAAATAAACDAAVGAVGAADAAGLAAGKDASGSGQEVAVVHTRWDRQLL